jgi:hypothetical protein
MIQLNRLGVSAIGAFIVQTAPAVSIEALVTRHVKELVWICIAHAER